MKNSYQIKNNNIKKRNKKFIFILCPPYQGSTIIVSLLDSSKNTSSFMNTKAWAGESISLLNNAKDMRLLAWNNKNKFNMSLIKQQMNQYLDKKKKIYIDKNPSFINQAQLLETYFSKYGKVYFIISIRNPYSTKYSAKNWVKYAKYQKTNIDTLNNTIITSYEMMCNDLPKVISRLKKKFPELSDISNLEKTKNKNKNERYQQINSKKVNRVTDKSEKNKILLKHKNLMDYFGYKINR